MKLEKLQFYLLIMLLFLFVGCGGEPDKYTIKVEVEDESTEWYLTLGEYGQDSTPFLNEGTMVFDLPTSKGFFSSGLPVAASITLKPVDSKKCFIMTVKNESTGQSQIKRGCGPFLRLGTKPNKKNPLATFSEKGRSLVK